MSDVTAKIIVSEKLARILVRISDQSTIAEHLRKVWSLADYLPSAQDAQDYLDVSGDDPLMFSYLPAKNYDLQLNTFASYFYNSSLRIKGKPAKTLRKFFGDFFTSQDYETFAAAWQDHQNPAPASLSFSIVEGEAILDAYSASNYAPEAGLDLRNSCMADPGKRDYLAIYADNPDACKLAVIRDQRGKIHARCLLWYGVSIDGQTSLFPCRDRIYHGTLEARAAMTQALADYRNIYNSDANVEISLSEYSQDYFPYMDTFRYSDDDGNFWNNDGNDHYYAYSSTSGARIKRRYDYVCDDCGCGSEDPDHLSHCNNGRDLCADCCGYVPSEGETYANSYIRYSDYHGENILRSEAVRIVTSDGGQDWALRDECTLCQDGSWRPTEETQETEDGQHYAQDSDEITEAETCERDEETGAESWEYTGRFYCFDSENLIETQDGRWIEASQAFEFDGETWHLAQTIETVEGARYPAARTDLYTVKFSTYGRSYHNA